MKYSNLYNKSVIVLLAILFIFAPIISSIHLVYGDTETGSSASFLGSTETGTPNSDCKSGQLCNPLQVNSIGDAINKGVEIFSYIAILVAVIMIIYVGLKFIFAQGKPEKLKEAGRWLGYIVIGVAIILGARLMISIVINTLQATNVVDPKVINSANSVINR